MRVGFLAASASRQAGGLLWAMAPLARELDNATCRVEVFAGHDHYSEDDLSYWGQVPLHVFDKQGPSSFGYCLGLSNRLQSTHLDLLHTHGLWMFPSVAVSTWGKRTGKPWIVSPHGMLDPWAIENSRLKKRLAGLAYENKHLRGAACLHALCQAEADAIRAYGLTNPIAVIPNGVELPELPAECANPGWAVDLPEGAQVLMFLGRLHPKKGLPALLQAWACVCCSSEPQWILVIAGWDQNGHRAELERIAFDLGIQSSVLFVGPQFGPQKAVSLQRANAFVLPSFSEGLPMAVLEAWAYGLPVLMTPQCNLPEGFAEGAAFAMEPDCASIAIALTALFGLSVESRKQMGESGRQLVEHRFAWPALASTMYEVYQWILGQGDKPSCVAQI